MTTGDVWGCKVSALRQIKRMLARGLISERVARKMRGDVQRFILKDAVREHADNSSSADPRPGAR